jgi:hypothetical protein
MRLDLDGFRLISLKAESRSKLLEESLIHIIGRSAKRFHLK